MVRDKGYVSAHRSKREAEKEAKQLYGKVIKTPKHLLKGLLKGKPYIVKI